VKEKIISARLRHENDKDDKENDKDAENLYHEPSVGCHALKVFD